MAGNAMHSRAVGAALACILKAGVGDSIFIAASASLLSDTLIPNWLLVTASLLAETFSVLVVAASLLADTLIS